MSECMVETPRLISLPQRFTLRASITEAIATDLRWWSVRRNCFLPGHASGTLASRRGGGVASELE